MRAEAAATVAPGVLFSTLIVVLVFIPLLMLSGLEGRFFRPLALSYICVFAMSLICAWTVVPSLSRIFRLGSGFRRASTAKVENAGTSLGIRIMRAAYRPFLGVALRFPKCVVLIAIMAAGYAVHVASGFGSSFLPPFREDSFNVMVSLPPGASLAETERVSEATSMPNLYRVPSMWYAWISTAIRKPSDRRSANASERFPVAH